MSKQPKVEVITFKADPALAAALRRIPNRSAFIRAALSATLAGVCPLCRGTGRLTPDQHRHWEDFSNTHALEECQECHALHLTCKAEEQAHGVSHQ